MDLIKISLNYTPVGASLFLNEEEWKNMIDIFIIRLYNNRLGKKFINRLNYFLNNGYTLNVLNKDDKSISIYPKTIFVNSRKVKIIIPSVPYFTQAKTIDPKVVSEFGITGDILSISHYNEIEDKLKITDKIEHLSNYTNQSFFITFVHELIHCLRYFENISSLHFEEEATIYGIKDKSLVIDDEIITENTIRREFNLQPRLSHDNKDIYIYNLYGTFENAKYFTKESFLMI